MRVPDIAWPNNIAEAEEFQERDRSRVRVRSLAREPEYIAGVDAAFSDEFVFGAACLYRYPQKELIVQSSAVLKAGFPYIPGYLFFREGPVIIAALAGLKQAPDLVIVEGQGIAHPRKIGSASHLGVLLGLPTIGCAKTRLVGEFREPGKRRGDREPLLYEGMQVGEVVRTRGGVKPLFVSPGHEVDTDDAVRIILACTGQYRIPEPLRCADMLSREMKRSKNK